LTPDKSHQPRRKLVLKFPPALGREDSAKSNNGNFGSATDSESSFSDAAVQGFESENWYEYSSDADESSEGEVEEHDVEHKTVSKERYTLTLTKHKTSVQRKGVPSVHNITANLPNNLYVNPFSLQYKERSFFIRSKIFDRPSRSADSSQSRSRDATMERHKIASESEHFVSNSKTSQSERPNEVSVSDNSLSTKKAAHIDGVIMKPDYNIAVFGRKAEGTSLDGRPPPPNTPDKPKPEVTPRRKEVSHLRQVLLAQKRDRQKAQVLLIWSNLLFYQFEIIRFQ